MSLPLNLKRLRKEKKISPDFLAKELGYNGREWIYGIEKGRIKRLDPETLSKMAFILGVTTKDLIGDDKDLFSVKEPTSSYETHAPFDELKNLNGYREKFEHVFNENRLLWKEIALLRKQLLDNGIKPETK